MIDHALGPDELGDLAVTQDPEGASAQPLAEGDVLEIVELVGGCVLGNGFLDPGSFVELDAEGNQIVEYHENDFDHLPITVFVASLPGSHRDEYLGRPLPERPAGFQELTVADE